MSDIYARQLEALRARSLDRHLREIRSSQGTVVDIDSKPLINFASNDYLGLAGQRSVIQPWQKGQRDCGSLFQRHMNERSFDR